MKIGQKIHIREHKGSTPQEVEIVGIKDGKVLAVKDKDGKVIEIIDQIVTLLPLLLRIGRFILSILRAR